MSQSTNVLLPTVRYKRTDYTALRAYCLELPIERIVSLYYGDDSPQVDWGLERYLVEMRDALVESAIESNPAFANALTHARNTGRISAKMLDILVQAAEAKPAQPGPAGPLAKLFRPRTAQDLSALRV